VRVDIYWDEVSDLIFEMQVVVPASELQEPNAAEKESRLIKLFYNSLGQFLREHFAASSFGIVGARSENAERSREEARDESSGDTACEAWRAPS